LWLSFKVMKFLKGLALRSATLHSAQDPLNATLKLFTQSALYYSKELYFKNIIKKSPNVKKND